MARYKSSYGSRECTPAKRYKAPKPLGPFTYKVAGVKVKEMYGELVAAWRAGTVYDFRYGARSEEDPTVVWTVDGTEYAAKDLAGVKAAVQAGFARAGIESVEVGPMWCGYASLTVKYVAGCVSVETYDGLGLVVAGAAADELAVAA